MGSSSRRRSDGRSAPRSRPSLPVSPRPRSGEPRPGLFPFPHRVSHHERATAGDPKGRLARLQPRDLVPHHVARETLPVGEGAGDQGAVALPHGWEADHLDLVRDREPLHDPRRAALVVVAGEENGELPPAAREVGVQQRPEALRLRGPFAGDQRIDEHERVGAGRLQVHRGDVALPAARLVLLRRPLGVGRRPAPQTSTQVGHFHRSSGVEASVLRYPARPMDLARRLAAPLALAALALLYLYTLGRPSLWFDEAWEANYYVGATDAPWYNRPVLYMSVEKALVAALGPSEFVLRLLPCLAGLATVAVTFVLVRQEAGRVAAWGAAALLALSPRLPVPRPRAQALHPGRPVCRAAGPALDAVARFPYHRAPARLRGGGGPVLRAVLHGGLRARGLCGGRGVGGAPNSAPLAPFRGRHRSPGRAVHRRLFLLPCRDRGQRRSPRPASHRLPSTLGRAVPRWLLRRTLDLLREETGNASSLAATALTAAGLWIVGRRGRIPLAFVLPGLLVMHIAAAVAHLYPYGVVRVNLDLAPFACAASAVALTALLPAAGSARAGGLLALAGVAWVLFQPSLKEARPYLTTGWRHEHIRPLVETLDRRRSPDEKIYVSDCGPPFTFYWWRHGHRADDPALIWGERHRYRPEDHRREVEAIAARHPRLWCLYSHVPGQEMATVRALFAEHYATVERYGEGDVGLDRLVRRGER